MSKGHKLKDKLSKSMSSFYPAFTKSKSSLIAMKTAECKLKQLLDKFIYIAKVPVKKKHYQMLRLKHFSVCNPGQLA